MPRILSFSDRLISHLDNALKTLSPGAVRAGQPSPGQAVQENEDLTDADKTHIGRLMRINHTGEVCAQALYQGQSLTARLDAIQVSMEAAADEELDHLAWCEERIKQLGGRTSYLNPAFYALSYGLGALAGAAGDKWSLGFVAATEDQVSQHLSDHLSQVDELDNKTTAILEQMLEDEQRHATHALESGGTTFPNWVKQGMTTVSMVMTQSTYRI